MKKLGILIFLTELDKISVSLCKSSKVTVYYTVYHNTRKHEHFHKKNGAHAVYKHLHDGSKCQLQENLATSRYALKLKKGPYVKWGDHELNKQKRSEKINLMV